MDSTNLTVLVCRIRGDDFGLEGPKNRFFLFFSGIYIVELLCEKIFTSLH